MEQAGLSTVTLSPIPDLTASVGAPRVAAISHPLGRLFGRPGDTEGQKDVLRASLRVLETADTPGTIVDLPFEWPESPSRAKASSSAEPPIATLLKRRPWLLPKLISREPPD
jgi:hypothetical protein